METYYNRTKEEWQATKEEIKNILIARIRSKAPISYTELAALIKTVSLNPESFELAKMLGDISVEENALNRGMLSVIVIKKGESLSGPGFFILAKELGRNTSEPTKAWTDEFNKVHACWAR